MQTAGFGPKWEMSGAAEERRQVRRTKRNSFIFYIHFCLRRDKRVGAGLCETGERTKELRLGKLRRVDKVLNDSYGTSIRSVELMAFIKLGPAIKGGNLRLIKWQRKGSKTTA